MARIWTCGPTIVYLSPESRLSMARRAAKKATPAKKATVKKTLINKAPEKKQVDERLQYYTPKRGRKDAILLDQLSSGDPFDPLNAAHAEAGDDGILYVSDTTVKPDVVGPDVDVRRVLGSNLERWLDRTGWEFYKRRPLEESGRIYAIAVKQ